MRPGRNIRVGERRKQAITTEAAEIVGGRRVPDFGNMKSVQGRANMQRNTDISRGRPGHGAPLGRECISDDSMRALIDRLRRLGFEVPPFYGARHNVAGGVPLQLAVRSLLRSAAGTGTSIDLIRSLLRDHAPFTLSLSDLGSGDAAIDAMQHFCDLLQAEIANSGASGEQVGLCIYSHQLPLQAFQLITRSVPGGGPRYVLLDHSQMTKHGDQRARSGTDKNWSFLWSNRMAPSPLKPAYGAMVRTACPLLADEIAASVLPEYGIQVPADSAWLPVSLALPQFADHAGEIRWDQLLPALTSGVELADRIMDRLHWSTTRHQSDARMNRRLAISITGLGDLVVRRGLAAQDLDALRWLSAIIIRIRQKLWHHSGEMARKHGCLPVLRRSDPSSGWDDSVLRESWRHCWLAALEKSAVRHRNMLVLSPYSVLPSAGRFDAAHTDLLPVIACADAWSFATAPRIRNWTFSDYKVFHRRAWAVIQGCKTGTLIAARV
jgi:hypothetical protein